MNVLSRRAKSLLSLCQRAGKLASGDDTALADIKSGRAQLVIVASDASDNTKKKFTDKCGFYGVPCRVTADREELSACVGRYNRTVFAVADEGFARQILAELDRDEYNAAEGIKG